MRLSTRAREAWRDDFWPTSSGRQPCGMLAKPANPRAARNAARGFRCQRVVAKPLACSACHCYRRMTFDFCGPQTSRAHFSPPNKGTHWGNFRVSNSAPKQTQECRAELNLPLFASCCSTPRGRLSVVVGGLSLLVRPACRTVAINGFLGPPRRRRENGSTQLVCHIIWKSRANQIPRHLTWCAKQWLAPHIMMGPGENTHTQRERDIIMPRDSCNEQISAACKSARCAEGRNSRELVARSLARSGAMIYGSLKGLELLLWLGGALQSGALLVEPTTVVATTKITLLAYN